MMRNKDFAEKETDAILDELEGRIVDIYSQAYKELREKFEKHTEKFAEKDAVMQQKLQSGKINEKDYLNWRQGQLFIENRLDQLVKELGSDLVNANKIATSVSNGYMPEAYALNFNYETYDIEQNTQIDTSFTLYSRESVEQLVKQKEITLPKRKVDVPKDQRWNVQHLNNEITQGILQGKSIPEISKSLRNVTDMNRKASVRNARTMMTGAQNSGRMDAYARADSLGIKIEKEWMATLDNRTRDSHQEMDGKRVDWKKPFENGLMYPGDPSGDPAEVYNCRCTMVPFYPDYADITEKRITYSEWIKSRDNADENNAFDYSNNQGSFIASFEKRGKGYVGSSMSVNAKEAYESGEKPASRWTKDDMLLEIENNIDDIDFDALNSLTKEELFRTFFEESSWHHTGVLYNKTYFYKLKDNIAHINKKDVEEIKLKTKKIKESRIAQKLEEKKEQERIKKVQENIKNFLSEDEEHRAEYKPSEELVNAAKKLNLVFSKNNTLHSDFRKNIKTEEHHDGFYVKGRYWRPSFEREEGIKEEDFYEKGDIRIVEAKDEKGYFKYYELQYWDGHKWVKKAR